MTVKEQVKKNKVPVKIIAWLFTIGAILALYYVNKLTKKNKVKLPKDMKFITKDKCSSLLSVGSSDKKEIIIPPYNPQDKTTVTRIMAGSFSLNGDVEKVFIPKSVTVIEDRVFQNCPKLSIVAYEGNEEEWNKIEKSDNVFAGTLVKEIQFMAWEEKEKK